MSMSTKDDNGGGGGGDILTINSLGNEKEQPNDHNQDREGAPHVVLTSSSPPPPPAQEHSNAMPSMAAFEQALMVQEQEKEQEKEQNQSPTHTNTNTHDDGGSNHDKSPEVPVHVVGRKRTLSETMAPTDNDNDDCDRNIHNDDDTNKNKNIPYNNQSKGTSEECTARPTKMVIRCQQEEEEEEPCSGADVDAISHVLVPVAVPVPVHPDDNSGTTTRTEVAMRNNGTFCSKTVPMSDSDYHHHNEDTGDTRIVAAAKDDEECQTMKMRIHCQQEDVDVDHNGDDSGGTTNNERAADKPPTAAASKCDRKTFSHYYQALTMFRNENGHCNVPKSYNPELYKWCCRQKHAYQMHRALQEQQLKNDYDHHVSNDILEEIRQLDDIGFQWQDQHQDQSRNHHGDGVPSNQASANECTKGSGPCTMNNESDPTNNITGIENRFSLEPAESAVIEPTYPRTVDIESTGTDENNDGASKDDPLKIMEESAKVSSDPRLVVDEPDTNETTPMAEPEKHVPLELAVTAESTKATGPSTAVIESTENENAHQAKNQFPLELIDKNAIGSGPSAPVAESGTSEDSTKPKKSASLEAAAESAKVSSDPSLVDDEPDTNETTPMAEPEKHVPLELAVTAESTKATGPSTAVIESTENENAHQAKNQGPLELIDKNAIGTGPSAPVEESSINEDNTEPKKSASLEAAAESAKVSSDPSLVDDEPDTNETTPVAEPEKHVPLELAVAAESTKAIGPSTAVIESTENGNAHQAKNQCPLEPIAKNAIGSGPSAPVEESGISDDNTESKSASLEAEEESAKVSSDPSLVVDEPDTNETTRMAEPEKHVPLELAVAAESTKASQNENAHQAKNQGPLELIDKNAIGSGPSAPVAESGISEDNNEPKRSASLEAEEESAKVSSDPRTVVSESGTNENVESAEEHVDVTWELPESPEGPDLNAAVIEPGMDENTKESKGASTGKTFEEYFEDLKEFHFKFGHCNIPCQSSRLKPLYQWCCHQRLGYKEYHRQKSGGKDYGMNDERIKRLEDLGFQWEAPKKRKDDSTNASSEI